MRTKHHASLGLCLVFCAGVAVASDIGDFTEYAAIPQGATFQSAPTAAPEATVKSIEALTFYANRVAWLANPLMTAVTTTFEDFSGTSVAPGSVASCPSPFNSATNNACFNPGAIAAGFSVEVIDTGVGNNDGVVLTPAFAGVDCVAVGPNSFDNNGVLSFTPTVRGVGFDLVVPGAPITFTIDILDPTGAPLGTTTATSAATAAAGAFWGVVSDDLSGIGSILVTGLPGEGELFCNVEFAGPPVPVELQSMTIE